MRKCGDCTLCCKLLPVRELNKPASTRCQYQRHTGCKVYHKNGMPFSCALWNCRWLVDPDTADLARPDRSHYVIDIMPDFVIAMDQGRKIKIQTVQIWVDPKHPDAHQDPKLRQYLLNLGEKGIVAQIRYNSDDAIIIIPPNMNSENKWVIKGGDMRSREELNQIDPYQLEK